MSIITDIIFPSKCISCGDVVRLRKKPPIVCDKCADKFKSIPFRNCEKCGKPYDINNTLLFCPYCTAKYPFEFLIAPFLYGGSAINVIHNLKFHNRPKAAKSIAFSIYERLKKFDTVDFEAIVSAPTGKKRFIKRGYSQTELIAKELSKISNKPYENILTKIKDTKPQSTLNYAMRLENVKGSIKSAPTNYKNILFIDDVYTSGSTCKECCKELKKAGAKKIYAAVYTITPQRNESSELL